MGDEVPALVAEEPDAFEEIRSAKNIVVGGWVRMNLASADGARVRELLEDAWRFITPNRVLAAYHAREAN